MTYLAWNQADNTEKIYEYSTPRQHYDLAALAVGNFVQLNQTKNNFNFLAQNPKLWYNGLVS